jgi:hypothetical protein
MYRHSQQRPFHLFRHSPLHAVQHLRAHKHGHRRIVVDREEQVRNWYIYSSIGAGFIVVALAVMSVVSYTAIHRAQRDLTAAKAIIANDLGNKALLTTADGRVRLASDIGTVAKDAAEATASLQGSTSLRLLGYLPYVGTQRRGVIQLSTDVELAANYGSSLLNALNNLVSMSSGTTVSLPALAALESSVVQGHHNLASLDRPPNGLLGAIANARVSFDRQDAKLVRLLSLSAKTIAFARPFLGSGGPQTYLIAGQNNAEMRDGGAVLSLDLLTTSNGTFSIHQASTYGDYALSTPAHVTLPAGTATVFGDYHLTQQWPETVATPNFALSGLSMQAMWAQATGQHVDGVIAMDVPAVASILKLTGPVTVAGIPTPVSASNLADILLNQAYQGLTVNDPQNSRRDKIAAVVKAAVNQMKDEHVDLDSFASALSTDVNGRHLMVWSDVPSAEAGLSALDAAGTLTTSAPDRTFHIAVENNTVDKLDFFVGVGVHLHVSVDAAGNALVNSTIKVVNFAQPGHAPSYQYGPDGVNSFTPGEYGARIFFWGPAGAAMPGSVSESGLQVVQTHFSLLPHQANQAEFATFVRHAVVDGHLRLRLVPQARLVPDRLTVDVSAPGWSVQGPAHLSRSWGSTLSLSWGLNH